jgi:hypothetical protein
MSPMLLPMSRSSVRSDSMYDSARIFSSPPRRAAKTLTSSLRKSRRLRRASRACSAAPGVPMVGAVLWGGGAPAVTRSAMRW